MMTNRQINALAAFIADGRPDWQPPGIVAALRHDRDHTDPWQLAAAIIRRASDPTNTTPRLQPFDHDHTRRMTCRTHPSAGTRTDGECGGCYADRVATRPFPTRHDTTSRPRPLEDALARLQPTAQATHNAHTTPDEATGGPR